MIRLFVMISIALSLVSCANQGSQSTPDLSNYSTHQLPTDSQVAAETAAKM